MFTGIVEELGTVLKMDKRGEEGALTVAVPKKWKIREGESIAVNGVCLSARGIRPGRVGFECMPETFRRTNLGDLQSGSFVNLERPLTLQSLLGGHLVQGHVDGVGVIKSVKSHGKSKLMRIGSLGKFSRYFLEKGSVAVDGVSLTIMETFKDGFSVGLIPLTQKETTLGRKRLGERVNIEIDAIVKIIDKLIRKTKGR